MKISRIAPLALAAALVAPVAGAQGKPAAKPDAAAAPAVQVPATAAADLKSGDPMKIRGALDAIRMAGKGGAKYAPTIAEVLAKGLTRELTEAAIDTLGDTESDAGSAAIAPYVRHRNVKLRQASVKALSKTKGPAAIKALRTALSDSDPMVRGLSANALGNLKAKEATADLFVALDHRVNEAAAAIGQLCGESECDQLATRLGKVPFDVVTGGLDQVLFRSDLGEDAKIKVIGKVRELGTGEANKFLKDVQKRMQGASPRIKQSIDQAIQATGG